MKKLAFIALASALSTAAWAQDVDYTVIHQTPHGDIPSLQAVNQGVLQQNDHDYTQLVYVGEHTPSNVVVKNRLGNNK